MSSAAPIRHISDTALWGAVYRADESDLSDVVAVQREILAADRPHCALEFVPLDLADVPARRELFQRLGSQSRRALIISEGLIIYFDAEQVSAFARDLRGQSSFRLWATDLTSPGLLKMLQKTIGAKLGEAGSPLKFAPREGPEFFTPLGWKPIETHSLLHTAAKLKRLSFGMRLLAFLPDPKGRKPDSPWGGVCVLENTTARPK